jgi:hypothetical protein
MMHGRRLSSRFLPLRANRRFHFLTVTRGAVLSQLPNEALVTSVVAPRHYGVKADCRIEDEDLGQKSEYDARLGFVKVARVCVSNAYTDFLLTQSKR